MLELRNISKTYRTKNGVTQRALNDVSLSFPDKGLVFIVGRSGGGKSTLLNMIAALDTPDRGEIFLFGNSFSNFSRSQLDSYRNTYVGVVFQDYNLLPTLNVKQNIALALGLQSKTDDKRLQDVISYLGLDEISDRKPNEISGGQAQRAAIARALVKDPKMIVADEPTGNLDSKTGREMFSVFKDLSKTKLVIIVTHDRDIADEIGDRVIEIKDGRVHKDLVRTTDLYEPAIDTVGDRLVRVPAGKKLDEPALDEINAVLARSERDTYIINESDTAKVKSMNIHVKNAVELRQEGNSSYYFPYRPEPETEAPISLIGARMPLSVGLKLSLSMLKHKKFRLVMTVIMLVLALFLSAVVGVFRFYDSDRAMAKTINSDKRQQLLVCKDGEYLSDTEFSDDDINYLKSVSDTVSPVYYGIDTPVFIDGDSGRTPGADSPFRYFYGLLQCGNDVLTEDDLEEGALPEKQEDAVISSVAAQYLLDRVVYKGVNSYADLIGKTFKYSGDTLRICGIKKADLSLYYKADLRIKTYGDSYSALPDEYKDRLSTGDGFVYVTADHVGVRIENTRLMTAVLESVGDARAFRISAVSARTPSDAVIYDDGQNGYAIDEAVYRKLFNTEPSSGSEIKMSLEKFNREANDYIIKQKKSESVGSGDKTSIAINDMHISAVIKGDSSVLYLDQQQFRQFVDDSLPVYGVSVDKRGSVGANIRLLRQLRVIGAHPDTLFYSDYAGYMSTLGILAQTLTRMLIMLSAVAALLLFSFISASVKLESRQIGILRGMGARGIDTFKAFGIEGAIITGSALVISLILVLILFPVINAGISSNYSYHFYSLVINPGTLLMMAITAIIITAVAISIPLIRLASMAPVSAMNKNETQR